MDYDFKNSFEKMPSGEPFVCSFSGGKDSVLALCRANDRGEARGLLTWYDEEQQGSVFHHQSIKIIQTQAESMGLPLIISKFTPWSHRLELIEQYKDFAAQGIKSIIFGDIYLQDSAKMQSILCKKAGLIPRFPLWGESIETLFRDLEERKIRTIISRVNTAYLDEKWLGKEYDQNTFNAFKEIDIDSFGEKGEFHTTVIDADIFKNSIDVMKEKEDGAEINLSKHELKNNIYRLIKNQ